MIIPIQLNPRPAYPVACLETWIYSGTPSPLPGTSTL